MKENNMNLKAVGIFAILAIVVGAVIMVAPDKEIKKTANLDSFARCLTAKEFKMYGAYWCSHCQNEKKAFGDSFKLIDYVECTDNPKSCTDAGIKGFPTWIAPDGIRLEGEQGIERLKEVSGCSLEEEPKSAEKKSEQTRSERNSDNSLTIKWGDIGQKLVSVGVLDREKFLVLYSGAELDEAKRLIDDGQSKFVVATRENSGILLNLLWGVGIGNKSLILEKGEMANPLFGGAGRFASTGGWTISDSDPMNHYSRHPFVVLTAEQEDLVVRVSRNIYRPCCDNPTHFPDCNHGMAMLGLLEILASDGADEDELYEAGLAVNRMWFPAQYEAVDRFLALKGDMNLDAKTLISANFASASGFTKIARELEVMSSLQRAPDSRWQGGGCSV